MATPSNRSDAIVEQILDRVSDGEPLAQVCRDKEAGMPGLRTFYDWMEKDEGLAKRFAQARDAGYDMIANDVLRISDEPAEMVQTETGQHRDSAHVSWQKNRMWARLQLLAKWDPKRYGDRLEVGGKVEGGFALVVKGTDK